MNIKIPLAPFRLDGSEAFEVGKRSTQTTPFYENKKDYKRLLRRIFKGKPLSDELCLYLHMPTKTDESIAPEGCESFYVLSLFPHLDADIDWNTVGAEYNDQILGFLE